MAFPLCMQQWFSHQKSRADDCDVIKWCHNDLSCYWEREVYKEMQARASGLSSRFLVLNQLGLSISHRPSTLVILVPLMEQEYNQEELCTLFIHVDVPRPFFGYILVSMTSVVWLLAGSVTNCIPFSLVSSTAQITTFCSRLQGQDKLLLWCESLPIHLVYLCTICHTYTNKKVKIIGSCNLYVIHPDTWCIEEIPFFVASNEGSILISCAISLALGLIKPHEKLNHPPLERNRNSIHSSADKVKKKDKSQLKVHMLVQKNKIKPSTEKISNVCSRDEQSVTSSNEQSNTTCTKNIENKNCQAEKCDMQPKKSKKDMQSNRPAMLIQHKITNKSQKQIVTQGDDKNCQSTNYYEKMFLTRYVKKILICGQ